MCTSVFFYLNSRERSENGRVSFRPTARLNEHGSLKAECKRRITSSHCIRLSPVVGYVRLSRVISGNFARRFRFQCMHTIEYGSQELVSTLYSLVVRYIV